MDNLAYTHLDAMKGYTRTIEIRHKLVKLVIGGNLDGRNKKKDIRNYRWWIYNTCS